MTAGRSGAAAAPPPRDPPDPREVLRRLTEAFAPATARCRAPLDELVLTILSQSTTDTNRDRAWGRLRERYPTWRSILRGPTGELEEVIRVAGLGASKAKAIRDTLARLDAETGELSLDHVRDMETEDAMAYLLGFPGVGTKTAACVLAFSLGRPVLPVDTHVHRIARRLGWVGPSASAIATHRALEARTRPADRLGLHLALIALGRRVCGARRPQCASCPLGDVCPRVGVEASAADPAEG